MLYALVAILGKILIFLGISFQKRGIYDKIFLKKKRVSAKWQKIKTKKIH
jgi:hypothetical protein